jgi:23S rRNA (adenine2503-C2)-methyltransferase
VTALDNIFGKTLQELKEIVVRAGLPAYSTGQIADWIYRKRVDSISGMSNISFAARSFLEKEYYIGLNKPVKTQVSEDGTKKYLFQIRLQGNIETVFIPEKERSTLCISSQIGCRMGCMFCMTGKMAFAGNLEPGDILNQIYSVPESSELTNYVFMGMGEPLLNLDNLIKCLEIMTEHYGMGLSASRITVSTIGIIPQLEQLLARSRCNIAISMHTPFDKERQELMPAEKSFPIRKVIEVLKKYSHERQRKISFEYIMFRGINDTARHINGLAAILNGLRCRINLIRYHPIPGVQLESSDEETIKWFKTRLNEKGITATIRASRGQDIFAACGMLSTQSMKSETEKEKD